MSIDWTAQQLGIETARRGAQMQHHVRRHNPRPAGVIRDCSATQAVQTVLQMRQGVFFRHGDLVYLTGRSTKAVCFALRYLQGQGVVRAVPDLIRNPRYLRYSATTAGFLRAQQLHLWDAWPVSSKAMPMVSRPSPEIARLRAQLESLVNRCPRWVINASVPVVRDWMDRRRRARLALLNKSTSEQALRKHIEAMTNKATTA